MFSNHAGKSHPSSSKHLETHTRINLLGKFSSTSLYYATRSIFLEEYLDLSQRLGI